MKKQNKEFLYYFMPSLIIINSIMRLVFDITFLEYKRELFYLLVLASTLYIVSFELIRRYKGTFVIIAMIIPFISLPINHYKREWILNFIYGFKEYMRNISRYVSGKEIESEIYMYLIAFTIQFLICVFVYVLLNRKKYILMFSLTSTLVFMFIWFTQEESALRYFIWCAFGLIIMKSFKNYEQMKIKWEKNKVKISKDIEKRLYYTTIITSIIIMSLVVIFPKDIPPIKWEYLDYKMQKILPDFVKWRNAKKSSVSYGRGTMFEFSDTDFGSKSGELGGPVDLKKVLLMEVRSTESNYLKGRVRNIYTGRKWESDRKRIIKNLKNYDITGFEELKNQGNIKKRAYEIKHINILTSSVFAPNNFYRVIAEKDYNHTDEGEVFLNNMILSGESYIVYTSEKYFNLMDVKGKTLKEEEKKTFLKYLEVPEVMSDRFKELVENITEDANGDYAKAKEIEKYLRENYKYDLKVPKTPLGKEFVDYFLFELKRGYCTYFATSMTMMAREAGIPARYVEGYKMPANKEKGVYSVYSKNGHAWTELYISGYGWMIFEPTSFYEAYEYEEKLEELEEEKFEKSVNEEVELDFKLNQLKELFEKEDYFKSGDMSKQENKTSNIKYTFIVSLIILSLLFARIMYFKYQIRNKKKRIQKMSNSEKVEVLFLDIQKILKLISMEKQESETIREYKIRVKEVVKEEYEDVFIILEKVVYSNSKVSNEEVEKIIKLKEELNLTVKNKIGTLKFLIHRYIIV